MWSLYKWFLRVFRSSHWLAQKPHWSLRAPLAASGLSFRMRTGFTCLRLVLAARCCIGTSSSSSNSSSSSESSFVLTLLAGLIARVASIARKREREMEREREGADCAQSVCTPMDSGVNSSELVGKYWRK
ncbi:hypothetical protein BpHYR1_006003 [Brachionus plicatilis]|uniref:Uncharacterized protein n=1 Tax=Brachionus plicatilis TaxID=10195 RepID=A0A3M7SX07_BRAPC|nr:hypothetical protein BpHYR1_006003 [Brachionus plicatilis]